MHPTLALALTLATGDPVVENTGLEVASSVHRAVHQTGPWTAFADAATWRLYVRDGRTGASTDLGYSLATVTTQVSTAPPVSYFQLDVAGRWALFGYWGSSGFPQASLAVHDLERGTTAELGVPSWPHSISGDFWLDRQGGAFLLWSDEAGLVDLNEDGDADDRVLHHYDAERDELVNLGIAFHPSFDARFAGSSLLVRTSELDQGQDLNGDGDLADGGIFRHELDTGAWIVLVGPGLPTTFYDFEGATPVIGVQETTLDLNGDGDVGADVVPHGLDAAGQPTVNLGLDVPVLYGSLLAETGSWFGFVTYVPEDLNNDFVAPDPLVHTWDPRTQQLVDTGIVSSALAGAWVGADGDRRFLCVVREKDSLVDHNGDGDLKDTVPAIWSDAGQALQALPWAVDELRLEGRTALAVIGEGKQGVDLNGDGQIQGRYWATIDLESGQVSFVSGVSGDSELLVDARRLWFLEPESQVGDLNGDGDALDRVLYGATLGSLDAVGTGLAAPVPGGVFTFAPRDFDAGWAAFAVSEEEQGGQDLNGDGDANDAVLHVAR